MSTVEVAGSIRPNLSSDELTVPLHVKAGEEGRLGLANPNPNPNPSPNLYVKAVRRVG